jgi:hypothetical protein
VKKLKLFMSLLEIEMRYQNEEFMRRRSEMFGRDQDIMPIQIGTK